MGWVCMARLGFTFQELKLQSTLKSLMSDVRATKLGATPIKSNKGDDGMENSRGVSFSVFFSSPKTNWECEENPIRTNSNKKSAFTV